MRYKKHILIGAGISAIIAGGIAGGIYFGGPPKDEVSKVKLEEKFNLSEIKTKYVLDNASLVKTDIKNAELDKYTGEPKDEVKVTLGDKDALEFVPNIELKRWNEVSFKIKTDELLKDVLTKDKNLTLTDKIKFDTPKISFEMYDFTEGEGGYKFIWYLNEKPATNKVEFQIESSGLDFFYQPPLTEEFQNGYSEEFQKEIVVTETQVKDLEGNVLVERPENVVGSYAVYHSTKGGMNDVYGKDYKTGQAFFIYRPRIIDAEGKEIWGILHIENGIYSVEIPQEFLDTAVYPIKSNDTFGNLTLGASGYGINFTFCSAKGNPNQNGIVTKLTGGLYQTASEYDYMLGLFQTTSGFFIATTTMRSLSVNPTAWYDFTFVSNPSISSSSYEVTVLAEYASTPYIAYNAGGTSGDYKTSATIPMAHTFLTSGWPTGVLFTDATNKHSVYATFSSNDCSSGCTDIIDNSTIWTAPTGVTSATVSCWGGGGGGFDDNTGSNGGAGGGGGAFASSVVSLTPGNNYTVTIASSSPENLPAVGKFSSFVGNDKTVLACGGTGATSATANGVGGTTACSTGDAEAAGGPGGDAVTTDDTGGGGGGAGGADGTGGTGSNGGASSGGNGGAGDNSLGGAGGIGGNGASGGMGGSNIKGGGGGGGGDNGTNGGAGGFPGGGGGGAEGNGGIGMVGACTITYTTSAPPAAGGVDDTKIMISDE